MRHERAERRNSLGNVKLDVGQGEKSGKIVAELTDVTKRYGERTIVDNFTATVMRGDKIGLIGPNGAGKTTLLKLILGEIQPDAGTVRAGTNIAGRLLRPDARAARPRQDARRYHQPGQRVGRGERREEARDELSRRLPVRAGARAFAGAVAVGRRAQPPAARAPVRAAGQRAGARRTDQRPRHPDARTAGRTAHRLRRHRAAREPRPRVPGQRRDVGVRVGRRGQVARICRRLQRLADPARTFGADRAGRCPSEREGSDRRKKGRRTARRAATRSAR